MTTHTTTGRPRAVQIVPGVSRTWSFRASALAALIFSSLGAGWLALNEPQREALLTLIGISPDQRDGLVALVLFVAAFSTALIAGLRALKQQGLEPVPGPAPVQVPSGPLDADTVPADSDPGRP
jgi:hypothetical protein